MPFPLSNQRRIKDNFIFYVLPYTAGFLLLQFIIYYPFLSCNKSFIWNLDGINQHYPALVYYSRLLKNLFAGKDIPLVDFNIGMGFDTLTTLNYYAIGDPVTLLSVFGGKENMEVIYRILILLRLYLSGISFLIYCIYRKKSGYPSVLGAFVYVFCGFVFYAGLRHPYFTNPLIYLPLLLLGIELILQKKRPYLFIIMTFISAVSNFYFFYMLTIITYVYAVIRFFYTYDKNMQLPAWKLFLKTAFRTGLYYLLGIAMSAVVLFPVLYAFSNNGRFNGGYEVNLLHYSPAYYGTMALSFIAPNITAGFWTQCTFAVIVPAAVFVVFRNRKYRQLRVFFIIGTVSLLIPFIGYLMNGFSYVCNRWEFGYSFLLAYLLTEVYEDLFCLKKTDIIVLAVCTIAYGVLGLFKPNVYILYGFLILCAAVFCIFFLNHYKKSVYVKNIVIFILVFVNLGLNGFMTYSKEFGNYTGEFIDSGKAEKTIQNSAVGLVSEIQDDNFYRVETYGDKQQNEGMTLGFHEVSGYFSIMDKRVSEFMKGLELVSQKASYRFDNLDYRTYLGTLAGVKYLAASDKAMVPYGYQLLKEEKAGGKSYYLYENRFALPFGYMYNRYITRDIYETLNPLQKQEVMLQAAVLEETIDSKEGIVLGGNDHRRNEIWNKLELKSEELPKTVKYGKGISREGDYIYVTRPGAKLKVIFKGKVNSETYLRLEKFNINDTDYYAMNIKVKGEKGVLKTINSRADRNNAYFSKEDYLVNLGYRKSAMKSCVITFPKTGKFHLYDIQIYSLPMTKYEEQIRQRKETVLQNISFHNSRITGTADTSKDILLCLPIPCSRGWKAYVNGVKTELLPANVMYMALPVKAGENKISLCYQTPLLKTGAAVSAAGCFLFFCFLLFWEKKYAGKKLFRIKKAERWKYK